MFISVITVVVIALMWLIFPPNKVNDFYGYRTSFAMQNLNIWNDANRICAKILLISSSASLLIISFIYWRFPKKDIDISNLLVILSFVVSIAITEIKLRQMYEKDGSKKANVDTSSVQQTEKKHEI